MLSILRGSTGIVLAAIAALLIGAGVAIAATTASITVPGTADPWLAGMPDGSKASFDGSEWDTAPAQSPKEVTGLNYAAGGKLTFTVEGSVSNSPTPSDQPPDGNSYHINFSHYEDYPVLDPENGISDINAPMNSLVGVFLTDKQPDDTSLSAPPSALDFGTPSSRDYSTLEPKLRQPFFIGDGRTSTNGVQSVTMPNGATRLFLGTMDGVGWYNNSGSFSVKVNHTPACTIGEIEPPVNDVSSADDTAMSAYKYGSRGVIPAKFKAACGGDSIDTQQEADAHPMKLKLTRLASASSSEAVVESTETGSANTGDLFRFVDADDHYIYNVAVKNLARGTYKLTISEANGADSQDEWFSIK